MASFANGRLTDRYMIPMQLLPYFGWGIGTGVGYIIGSILPDSLQESMGIGLYALFVALLVPEIKKTRKALVLASLSAFANSVLHMVIGIKQGWSIVISIILVSLAGVLLFYKEEVKDDTEGEMLDDTIDETDTMYLMNVEVTDYD